MFQYNVYFGSSFSIIYLQQVNIKVSFHIFTESQTSKLMKQAISPRERALCQLTVCFEIQSKSE